MASIGNRYTAPSGPMGYPMLGHLPDFLRDKLGFLSRCTAHYGDVVKLKIGGPTYLLNNPEDIKYVLVTNSGNYDKTPRLISRRGKRLSGEGLLTSSGETHLRQRRMLQPLFHHKSIEAFADEMVNSTNQMLARWKNGAVLNIADEMMSLVQRIMLKALFSTDIKNNIDELAEAISIRRRYIKYMFHSLFPFPEYLLTRINRKYRQAIRQIDNFTYGLIRTRRNAVDPPNDFLSMLIGAHYEDGTMMSDKQVRDEVLTFSITGYETIGEALTWTWYLLSQHPQQVESKLLAELDEVLGDRPPDIADLPKLNYTKMILSESMRLYPPTWIFVRVACEEDVLPSGITIPVHSKIYLCQYVTHRNPRYFPEPEQFDPMRFSDVARQARPKFAYFPFGGGSRLCIGESFAMMEGMILLTCIAQQYKLELLPGQVIVPEPGITLRPKHGVIMRLIQR